MQKKYKTILFESFHVLVLFLAVVWCDIPLKMNIDLNKSLKIKKTIFGVNGELLNSPVLRFGSK